MHGLKRYAVFAASVALAASLSSVAWGSTLEPLANGGYTTGVTEEMCDAGYWAGRAVTDPDALLATSSQCAAVTKAGENGSGTNMRNMATMINSTYAANTQRQALADGILADASSTRAYYANGTLVDNEEYFGALQQAVRETGYTDETRETGWGIVTGRVEMKSWPTADFIGYSATDPDDEATGSAMVVGEPFAVRAKAEVDGHLYYWGYSVNCSGWVDGEQIALCRSKEEWLGSWQTDEAGSDRLIVTESSIYTEESQAIPAISNVQLDLGCSLKLVADEDIPTKIGERRTFHNYVVYLPTRQEDGTYQACMALISERYSLSEGYLPLTQRNVLNVAFSCLGDRYGWGGCQDAMDCSMYTGQIYRCFGITLPRNTTWQVLVPGISTSIEDMTDAEKVEYLSTLPVGALLYFNGHTMMYLGCVGGVPYVVSAVGTFCDTAEDAATSAYGVDITPLTVRRGNGSTWLSNLNDVVVVTPALSAAASGIKVTANSKKLVYSGKVQTPTVSVTGASGQPLPSSMYSVSIPKAVSAGTYTVTVSVSAPSVAGTLSASVTIAKAAAKTTIATSKIACKAGGKAKVRATATSKGAITFTKVSGSSKIKVSKNGTVSVAKGLKSGKTYRIKVKAKLAATKNFKSAAVTKVIKVKVLKK